MFAYRLKITNISFKSTMIFISLLMISLFLLVKFELVALKEECTGNEIRRADYENVGDCAQSCYMMSSMFVFSTARCGGNPIKCRCVCETAASKDGECVKSKNADFNLYKFI